MKIIVYKSQRLLVAMDGENEIMRCAVSLGSQPLGAKTQEGDGKTPEGSYYVCTKNARSKFTLALGVSYPNVQDAESAFALGRIDQGQRDAILDAQARGKRPPWDTPLGGFIMIHGEHPQGKTGDWTAGCVALSNADISRLFALASLGDEVEIFA